MAKLKLGAIEDDKPIKITLELPASVHRDLVAYAEVLASETGRSVGDPIKLISPMIERFMATDLPPAGPSFIVRVQGFGS